LGPLSSALKAQGKEHQDLDSNQTTTEIAAAAGEAAAGDFQQRKGKHFLCFEAFLF